MDDRLGAAQRPLPQAQAGAPKTRGPRAPDASFLGSIELARGAAALAVVCAHVIFWGNQKAGLGAPGLVPVAERLVAGVDLFFIISGFIMVHTTKTRPRPVDFLKKRLFRILPTYWLISLPLIPLQLLHPELINASSAAPTSIVHSLLLMPYEGLPLLMVAWTLQYELYFYLLFTATLRMSTKHQVMTVSGLLCLSTALGFAWGPSNPILALMTSPLLLEFAFGMVCAALYKRLRFPIYASAALFFAGVTHIALCPVDAPRIADFGIGCALMFVGLLGLERARRRSSDTRFARLAGELSYPLYLVHVPVISLIGRGSQAVGIPLEFPRFGGHFPKQPAA